MNLAKAARSAAKTPEDKWRTAVERAVAIVFSVGLAAASFWKRARCVPDGIAQ